MSEIKAVLLVPEPGDKHGLLKEGPCGARPPMAWTALPWPVFTGPNPRLWHPGSYSGGFDADAITYALVLAWDGELVAEVQPYIERAGIDFGLLAPFIRCALAGMDIGQGPWPGTLVLLDAEGREVK